MLAVAALVYRQLFRHHPDRAADARDRGGRSPLLSRWWWPSGAASPAPTRGTRPPLLTAGCTASCSRPACCSSRSRDTRASRRWAKRCRNLGARSLEPSCSRSDWPSPCTRIVAVTVLAVLGPAATASSAAPLAEAAAAAGWGWTQPVVRIGAAAASRPMAGEQLVSIGGRRLRITNLDKVLYPETGTTKGEVIDYYTRIGADDDPARHRTPRHPQAVARRSGHRRSTPSSRSSRRTSSRAPPSGCGDCRSPTRAGRRTIR